MSTKIEKQRLEDVVLNVTDMLDRGEFKGWLTAYCTPEFEYSVTAHSDEIGKKMLWMSEKRDSLAALMDNVRMHEQYPGRLRRHVSALRVVATDPEACTEASVVFWYTDSTGQTKLFAVGKYIDRFALTDDKVLLASREVFLDTRRLPIGCHVAL